MKRSKLLALLSCVCLILASVALPFMTTCASKEGEEYTVKVGWLGPLTGGGSGWFIPGRTGLAIWVDDVNARGGLLVGDDRYFVEIVEYDDEGLPNKALLGAKKLVLEDKVAVLIMPAGAEVSAVQEFINTQEFLCISMCTYDIGADRPWQVAVSEGSPMYSALGMQYIADNYPEVKRVAATAQDDEYSDQHLAWELASLEVNGLDIVYSKQFSPDTLDLAPVVSAILATTPDLITTGGIWPEFQQLLVEQLYSQGYEGLLESSEWNIDLCAAKVPEEYLEGAITYHPNVFTDPSMPAETREFYQKWMAIYGPGSPKDVKRSFYATDYLYWNMVRAWEWAVERAGTFDSRVVRDTLLAADVVPTVFGPGQWWGADVYGSNYSLMFEQYISTIQNGQVLAVGRVSIIDWWANPLNRETTLRVMEENNLMYFQR